MYLNFSGKNSIKDIIDNKELIYKWNVQNVDKKEQLSLGVFKRINLFIGSNNSGKSRFLRSLIKSQQLNDILVSNSVISFNEQISQYFEFYSQIYSRIGSHSSITQTLQSYKTLIKKDFYNFIISKNNFDNYPELCNEITEGVNTNIKNKFQKEQVIKVANKTFELILIGLKIQEFCPNKKIYIPMLRTLLEEKDHLKEGSIKQIVEKKYSIKNNVFTGLELYKTVHKLKNSGRKNKKEIEKFEEFLSNNFFMHKPVELNANIIKEDLEFTIDNIEHPIYNLGDGIQALIILLFPVFTAEKNDWFFIEEPETNLHPGLQKVYIETLLNDEYLRSKNLRYFFTTHSNHFLDTSIQSNDISIFQFEKKEDSTFFIKTNVKPEKEVLDILGVNTSSVFLSNTSVWVEGPTDRKYISKFLKLYCNYNALQPLKEDIDFAFFEYGGNLIEHYLFDEKEEFNEEEVRNKINTFALSNKIFLLADNDGAEKGSKKDSRRIALKKLSDETENFYYQNTELKEIENLLPKKIVQDFMKELISKNESQEKSQKIKFKREDYKNIGLGEFYSDKFKNYINKNHLKSFKAESGTLKNNYKIKLASFVVDSEYTYSDLIEDNKELETIIENLYSFITK